MDSLKCCNNIGEQCKSVIGSPPLTFSTYTRKEGSLVSDDVATTSLKRSNHYFKTVHQLQFIKHSFWGLKEVYCTCLKALAPHLPSTLNWSASNYSSPMLNYQDPPPFLPLYMEWCFSCDIGYQAPTLFSCMLKRSGSPRISLCLDLPST